MTTVTVPRELVEKTLDNLKSLSVVVRAAYNGAPMSEPIHSEFFTAQIIIIPALRAALTQPAEPQQERDALKAQNAELLDALESCEAFLLSAGFAAAPIYQDVSDAIARAEKGQQT